MLERPHCERAVTQVVERPGHHEYALLSCGHQLLLERRRDGVLVDPFAGPPHGAWPDIVEASQPVAASVDCLECDEQEYQRQLAARPASQAQRYPTRDACLAAHPDAKWEEYGPVHRHGDTQYVKVYLGGHEWVALNVLDLRDAHPDPGWEGTEYGWAYVPAQEVRYALATDPRPAALGPPERAGRPITGDELLLGDPEQVRLYLGPNDPLLKGAP